MTTRMGIGQDSHRFETEDTGKKCIIAGIEFDGVFGWDADSDGDIVLHSICNAITSLTHVPIMGGKAITMCHEEKITDSAEYLKVALETLGEFKVAHVALTIELKKPKMQPSIDKMRANVARLMDIEIDRVGITCTSGDGLTQFAQGLGGQCFCILTVH